VARSERGASEDGRGASTGAVEAAEDGRMKIGPLKKTVESGELEKAQSTDNQVLFVCA
jgi:hypothetical protein